MATRQAGIPDPSATVEARAGVAWAAVDLATSSKLSKGRRIQPPTRTILPSLSEEASHPNSHRRHLIQTPTKASHPHSHGGCLVQTRTEGISSRLSRKRLARKANGWLGYTSPRCHCCGLVYPALLQQWRRKLVEPGQPFAFQLHPDSHRGVPSRLDAPSRLSQKASHPDSHGRRSIRTLTGGGISSRLIQTRAHCTAVQPPHYCNNTATTPLQQPCNATTTLLPGWGHVQQEK